MIKVYSDPGNLVLVMGTTDAEEEHFTRRLAEDSGEAAADKSLVPPKKITTDYSTSERQGVYLQVVSARVIDSLDLPTRVATTPPAENPSDSLLN